MATRRTGAPLRHNQGKLAGASVIITRPAATSAALKQCVRTLGGSAIGLPGIGLRAVEDPTAARLALKLVEAADVVIFVSPPAVRFAFMLRPGLRFARGVHVCAVGAATARALLRRGIPAVAYPQERQDSEGLLALPQLQKLRGRQVALIAAPGGRDVLPRELQARGARIQRVDVYRRGVPRLDRRHLTAVERAPAPLITLISSAEALTNLHTRLPAGLFARIAAGDCVVSSLRLALLARSLGCVRVHVAASAASAAMLSAACDALAQHRL